MAPTVMKLTNMLNSLEEEDYNIAISFIQYLSETRKKKKADESKKILKEIHQAG